MSRPVVIGLLLVLITLLRLGWGQPWNTMVSDIDYQQSALPWAAVIQNAIEEGTYPHWYPYTYCGQPNRSTLWYPPAWLFCILPAERALELILTLHFLLYGAGTYLVARRLELSPVAAAIAALFVTWGGPVLNIKAFWSTHFGLSWVPLCIYTWLRRDAGAPAWIGWSCIWGLMVLTAAPHPCLFAGLAWLCLWLVETGSLQERLRSLGWAVSGMATGCLLSAPMWLGLMEAGRYSPRIEIGTDLAFADSTAISWSQVPTLFWPVLGENPYALGTVVFLFGMLGVVQRSPRIWLGVRLFTVASFLMALGSKGGMLPLLVWLVPPLKVLRFHQLFLAVTGIGLALFAGKGVDRWLTFRMEPPLRWGVIALAAVELWMVAPITTIPRQELAIPEHWQQVRGPGTARVLVTTTDDRLSYGATVRRDNIGGFDAVAPTWVLASVEFAALGRMPQYAEWYRLAQTDNCLPPVTDMDSGFLKLAGVRARKLLQGWQELPGALPRYFVCPSTAVVASREAALEAVYRGWPSAEQAIVEQGEARPAPAEPQVASIEETLNTLGTIRLKVTSSQPGVLVLAQSEVPGWTARVDGVATPIVRTYGVFQGIPIAAGTHSIELLYRQQGVYRIAVLGMAGGVLLLVLGGFMGRALRPLVWLFAVAHLTLSIVTWADPVGRGVARDVPHLPAVPAAPADARMRVSHSLVGPGTAHAYLVYASEAAVSDLIEWYERQGLKRRADVYPAGTVWLSDAPRFGLAQRGVVWVGLQPGRIVVSVQNW